MKLSNSLLLLAILISCLNTSYAQADKQVILFRLTEYNNIVVHATLNSTDKVDLMLHTAASAVTITQKAVKNTSTLRWSRTDEVNSWGGKQASRYSARNALHIGAMQWSGISIWENERSGLETDGKFGLHLFKGKIVELDFDKKQLTIHNTLPAKVKSYEQLPLIVENDLLFIEATIDTKSKKHSNQFLIHTGYSGSILLDDNFVQNNEISTEIKVTHQQELKDSYGNIVKTKKGILPSFAIGSTTLQQVPVGFFEGAISQQRMSVIGGDLLKRFNIIIDAAHQYIYMKPNQLMSLPHSSS